MNRHVTKRAAPRTMNGHARGGAVVSLAPVRALARASRELASSGRIQCPKCASGFVAVEPAFLHCHYCGNMARIPSGSLLAQEEFEMRSGLRLAS